MSSSSEGPTKARSGSGRFAKKNGDAVKPDDEAASEPANTGATHAKATSTHVEDAPPHVEPAHSQARNGVLQARAEAAKVEAGPTQAEAVAARAGNGEAKAATGAADSAAGALQTGTRALRGEIDSVRTHARDDVRFRIFIIDTGWNSPASRALRQNLNMIGDLSDDDEVYVLDRETSVALMRHYPLQVGRDPIITVHDTRAPHRHLVRHTHGFRMHLGILNTEEQVLAALQMFSRFLLTHRNVKDLEKVVRKDLHRQGIAGAIEIMGGHEHQKMISE